MPIKLTDSSIMCTCVKLVRKAAFTRAPGPESGFESGSQSTWERWSESGVCLRVNATNLDQDLDQNPHVNMPPRGGGGGGGIIVNTPDYGSS